MATFVTSDPRSAGLAAAIGTTVLYVSGGAATALFKYGAGNTAWCTVGIDGGAEPVTADPRSSGLARPTGSRVLYVTGGAGTLLYKYGSGNTNWCTWTRHSTGGAISDGDYGDVTVSGSGLVWTIDSGSHTHAQSDVTDLETDLAAKAPTARTISTTAPLTGGGDLSANRTLAVSTFDSGASGVVPASGGGTSNFLRADGTWAAPPGGSSPAGVLSDLQISVVQSPFTLAAASGVQSVFPSTQDVFTVDANSTYRVRGQYLIATGTTTHTTAMAWSLATATVTSFEYLAMLWSAAANTIATAQSTTHVTGVASKVLNATSAAARTMIQFEGILVIGTGGTITPQINFSANPTGTNQTLRGSYISFEKLGTDTDAEFGGWA